MTYLALVKDESGPDVACVKCGVIRPQTTEFYRRSLDKRRGRNVLHWRKACRECDRASSRKWAKDNAEACRIKVAKQYKANPQVFRDRQRSMKYGITPVTYKRMLESQGGGCGICGRKENYPHPNGRPQAFGVDHCHVTGKIRGLLCELCNKGIGLLKDKKEFLLRAVLYLERNG